MYNKPKRFEAGRPAITASQPGQQAIKMVYGEVAKCRPLGQRRWNVPDKEERLALLPER